MTEAMASWIYKEIQFVWFNLVFHVHFRLVVLCSTAIIEQEVIIQSLSDISPWTVLKTSHHLTGKCKSYKPVWSTTWCSFPSVPSAIPQIHIGWISVTKKSTDSECQPSTLLHVWEGKEETGGLLRYFHATCCFIELFFTSVFIWFLYKIP